MSRKLIGWLLSIGFLFASLLAFPIAGQAQTAPAPSVSTPPSGAAGGAQIYEYRFGSGDKLRLIVFGEPDLSGEFIVSGEGKVSLPLIGEVLASGATATELQDKIATALKQGYIQNPRVNVEVLTFRPFYILGEVNKPGQYDFSNGMTVERAVATASGYTYRADHKKVFIKHANQDQEEAVKVTSQIMIAPGDTIRIPERYF